MGIDITALTYKVIFEDWNFWGCEILQQFFLQKMLFLQNSHVNKPSRLKAIL